MKLVVFSDSHTDLELMAAVAARVQPDALIHLGDHYSDAIKLGRRFPALALHAVLGNCDICGGGSKELLITLDGKKLLLSHGHQYSVKNGLAHMKERGLLLGADATLFGHTHRPLLEYASGMLLVNPGHIGRLNASPPTYAILRIEDGALSADIVEAADG